MRGKKSLYHTHNCVWWGVQGAPCPLCCPQPSQAKPLCPVHHSSDFLREGSSARSPRAVSVQSSPRNRSHSVHRGLGTSQGRLGPGQRSGNAPQLHHSCPNPSVSSMA